YLLFYQTILWTLAGMRILRTIVLGLTGTSFFAVGFLPFYGKLLALPWFSQTVLIPVVIALSLAAFAIAWLSVSRQRTGGGRRRSRVIGVIDRITDALPRRRKNFSSTAAAQFWFEWRRIGWLLPLCIGTLLVFVIAPLSWNMRHDRIT